MNNRNLKSKRIAVCGILSALSLTCMLMGSFFPFSSFLAPAISGILILPVVLEYKLSTGCVMFAAISLLSLFIAPNKESVAIFIAILGWYPFVKLSLDKLKYKVLLWVLKITIFNTCVALVYLFIIVIFPIGAVVAEFESMSFYFVMILVIVANITFVIYDKALERVVFMYMHFWRKRIFS